MEQVCVDLAGNSGVLITGLITTVISIASALSNFISKDTFFGKVVNLLAVNIKVEKKK